MYEGTGYSGFAGRVVLALALVSCVNALGATREVRTLTVATATAAATYSFSLMGYPVSMVAVGATKPLIAAELATELNGDSRFFGRLTFLADGVDKVTITHVRIGESFPLTTSDAKLTAALGTAAAEAANIPFCSPVVRVADSPTQGVLPCGKASALITSDYELTVAYTSGREISFYGELENGKAISVTTVMATDLATSRTAFISAFNAAADAAIGVDDIVIAEADGSVAGQINVSIVVPGLKFKNVVTNFTWEDVTESNQADAKKLFVGITIRDTARFDRSGNLTIPPRESFSAIKSGEIVVTFEDDPNYGDAVYYNYVTEKFTSTPDDSGTTVFVPYFKVGLAEDAYYVISTLIA